MMLLASRCLISRTSALVALLLAALSSEAANQGQAGRTTSSATLKISLRIFPKPIINGDIRQQPVYGLQANTNSGEVMDAFCQNPQAAIIPVSGTTLSYRVERSGLLLQPINSICNNLKFTDDDNSAPATQNSVLLAPI